MADPNASEAPVQIRPASFADATGIDGVRRKNGLDPLDGTAWRQSHEGYPFAKDFTDLPLGWVLETGAGEIVGSLGNVPMLYHFGDRHLRASIAASWVVDAAFRGKALHLVTAFYRQKGVDLWINGSANPAASRVLDALKIPRMPIPDYASPCFWPVRRYAFALTALRRKSVRGAALLAYPAAVALAIRDFVKKSGRGSPVFPVRPLHQFDDRFDAFWTKLSAGPRRLRAVRNRAVLDWRFGAELRSRSAVIAAVERAGGLTGYAVLRRRQQEMGMDLYEVADLEVLDDDAAATRDLLLGSIHLAHEHGADALKLATGTPAKRRPAEALFPYSYQLSSWQLFYKTAARDLQIELSSAEVWDFSLFDTY